MRALLVDLDGVLYVGGTAVPGAAAAIDYLDQAGVPYLYVTNTTSRPRQAIVDKLAGFGVRTTAEKVLTPALAAAAWLSAEGLKRLAVFVPEATAAEFAEFDVVSDHVGEDPAEPVDALVVGDLGEGWDFFTLNRAFRLLMMRPQPRLIALGMTRYWRAADGLRLDTAPFVMALGHAADVEPVVLGKPAAAFFQVACSMLGSTPAETVMIGDDIRTDVEGAQRCGLAGVLVRTGKFREADLAAKQEPVSEPVAVLDSIADLPGWWQTATGRA